MDPPLFAHLTAPGADRIGTYNPRAMRRLLPLALFLFAASAHGALQSPSELLGFQVGADRKLADYRQIVPYFRALDAASPRVALETLGKTTLGEEMIMAVISSEENMRNLERIRETSRKLADP